MFCYSLYFCMAFIHDVMHEVFAVTCVCVCVRMRSGACTTCCTVLSWLLTGLLFPVSCLLFLGRRGRHLSLGSLVTTSQRPLVRHGVIANAVSQISDIQRI